jgi:Domain of unknown function (DUF222)
MFGMLADLIKELDPPCSLDAVRELVALRGRFDAIIANLVGDVDAAGLYGIDDCVSMNSWLRHHCNLTKSQAGALVSLGRAHRQFPVMAAAARDGSVSAGQVSVITTVIKSHLTEQFAEHEADIIPTIVGMNIADTAAVIKHWAAHADALADTPEPLVPEGAVHLSSTFDGTWHLSGTLSDEAGITLRAALDIAMPAVDDRTPSARQHDALVAIARFYLDHHRQPSAPRRRPHVNLIINIDDLDTMRNATTVDGAPLNPRSASTLLCDSVIHRVVTDNTGAILNVGRAQRTVTASIWAALVIRDRHCRFPHCDRAATACDAHHVTHWGHGGETSLDNLVLFCPRHHHLCHAKNYEVKLLPDASVEVTKPDGTVITSRPPNHSPPQLRFD